MIEQMRNDDKKMVAYGTKKKRYFFALFILCLEMTKWKILCLWMDESERDNEWDWEEMIKEGERLIWEKQCKCNRREGEKIIFRSHKENDDEC